MSRNWFTQLYAIVAQLIKAYAVRRKNRGCRVGLSSRS